MVKPHQGRLSLGNDCDKAAAAPEDGAEPLPKGLLVQERSAKSVLSPSRVYDYAVNPYGGCSHGCRYCYAAFMRRFTGHREPWGTFVDVKINAPTVLAREAKRRPRGRVWMSGVCDPYQPLEERYRLTVRCLAALKEARWSVTIQTKSALVLRDLAILEGWPGLECGFSIGTADEAMRVLFEPSAPPIAERIAALVALRGQGIRTFAMIAPILPGAEGLAVALSGKVDHVLIDRLNYFYADKIYRENGLEWARTEAYFRRTAAGLVKAFKGQGTAVRVLF